MQKSAPEPGPAEPLTNDATHFSLHGEPLLVVRSDPARAEGAKELEHLRCPLPANSDSEPPAVNTNSPLILRGLYTELDNYQGFPLLLHLLAKRIDSEAKDVVLQCPPAATGTTTQEPTTATIPMLDFFDPQVPFCIGFRLFNIVKERRFVEMMAESRIVALDTLVMSAPLYRRGRDSVLVDPARAWCSPHLIRSYALDFGIGGLSYYVNQYIDCESMPIATSGRNCEPYGCSSTEASDDSKSNLRSVLVTTPGDTPHP
ncbi:hypothetical protein BKA70DRAFT_1426963 [Coprinopsis sp. MPI-PUGE-AT-0042]|nr:hypothetical protein BKA70DRAFT_1426963 [Coprinopsis sp. MPI-PUGE-AT-0042]